MAENGKTEKWKIRERENIFCMRPEMHIPEAFWVPFLPWEVRDMSESKEVILEAKHVTRRFRTTDG